MLHIEGRQGSPKDSGALIVILACSFFLLLTGCQESATQFRRSLSLDSFAEMKVEEYVLKSQLIRNNLEQFCADDHTDGFVASQVRKYYREGGSFLWVDMCGVDERADTLVTVLSNRLSAIGFNERFFRLSQIKDDLERLRTLQFTDSHGINTVVPRLEYNLTRAYLLYASGQRFGFVNPVYLLNRRDARDKDSTGRVLTYRQLFDVEMEHPDKGYVNSAFRQLSNTDSLASFLRQAEPSDGLYVRLQKMLSDSTEFQRQCILVNMERCRWRELQKPEKGQKYIVVNVPAFHLWAVGPDSVLDMRAACGALKTKTPLLSSHITHMEVNPEWIMPMSIVRDDVVRHAGDTSYFLRHRYYIVDRKSGKRVPVSSVSQTMLRSGNYRVTQEGGAGNSLGRIIFRFPNNFSVFLHDTSSPGVFHRDNRGVSHGCVRVQRPFDLALFMMGETPDEKLLDKLRISMGLKPVTDWGRDCLDALDPSIKTPRLVRSLPVSHHVPIFITYYTIFQTPEGKLQNYPDVYGYDKCISDALKPLVE